LTTKHRVIEQATNYWLSIISGSSDGGGDGATTSGDVGGA
jgi:hypothetical protein